jgi:hypothetical protein
MFTVRNRGLNIVLEEWASINEIAGFLRFDMLLSDQCLVVQRDRLLLPVPLSNEHQYSFLRVDAGPA